MTNPTKLSLVVQAGGASSRMGQNKALMPFLGQPLIERVIGRLIHLAGEVLVTTNQPEGLAFLGVPLVPDVLPGMGALGGLYTALSAASLPVVALVACDMPFAGPALLAAERDLLDQTGADVVIPRSEFGYEPLHAVYRREICLGPVRAALDAGNLRMVSWFSDVKVRVMELDELRLYDPDLRAFLNVNTPEEFVRAEAMADKPSSRPSLKG